MNEAQWLAETDTERLLDSLLAYPPRKFRLLSVACCRAVAPATIDERCKWALDVAEREADDPIGHQEMINHAWLAAREVGETFFAECVAAAATPYFELRGNIISLGGIDFELAQTSPFSIACSVIFAANSSLAYDGSRSATVDVRAVAGRFNPLIHDIFGNPFRPVAFSPEWRTSTVVAIAQGMYESRDFSAMPILADALQEAGCDKDDILTHSRDADGVHVRGCWVVDMILGKS